MIRVPIRADSLESESYRTLRTTLSYTHLPDGHRAVLFTSARRGEGKTTTAANFAAICAYAERPTLLIDADLRSPQIGDIFGFDHSPGLSGALGPGRLGLEDVVVPTRVAQLDVVPAGAPVTNPAELLARPQLAELIEAARAQYAWVIVDSPPVLPIADAVIVSRFVDGVVLVVDVSRTPIDAARRAQQLLRAVDAPLLGLVANRSRTKTTQYGYGRYPG